MKLDAININININIKIPSIAGWSIVTDGHRLPLTHLVVGARRSCAVCMRN